MAQLIVIIGSREIQGGVFSTVLEATLAALAAGFHTFRTELI